jgi:predicted RNA polymerase sigma factor
VTAGETHQAIEATFRIERARLIAGLARMVRNVDLAEELAQDALVVALAEWPKTGVPANPGAWLMAVAKRRAIDACHPMLSPDARAALTLRPDDRRDRPRLPVERGRDRAAYRAREEGDRKRPD